MNEEIDDDDDVDDDNQLRVYKYAHESLVVDLCDSRTVTAAAAVQQIPLSSILIAVIAVLVGVSVVVFIALVCYYRRRTKTTSGDRDVNDTYDTA